MHTGDQRVYDGVLWTAGSFISTAWLRFAAAPRLLYHSNFGRVSIVSCPGGFGRVWGES